MKISYLDGRPDEVVEDRHFRVELEERDSWHECNWRMTIDLTEMCETAGSRIKYYDPHKGTYVYLTDYPASRFRKALKLIRTYADDDQQEQVLKYLDANYPKWAAEFRKLR